MPYQLFSTLQRGYTHPLFCEDFLFTQTLGQRYLVAAVMDGSTMGKTSYFTSTLIAKLLNKVSTTLTYQPELVDTDDVATLGQQLLKLFFEEFKQARNQLFLSQEETMSTLLLAVVDLSQQKAWVIGIGDGVIVANDEVKILDQNNQPDYVGYHINQSFDEWFGQHKTVWEFEQLYNLSIATDGVLAFEFDNGQATAPSALQALMVDKLAAQEKYPLDQVIAKLRAQHQAGLQDDVAVVRVLIN